MALTAHLPHRARKPTLLRSRLTPAKPNGHPPKPNTQRRLELKMVELGLLTHPAYRFCFGAFQSHSNVCDVCVGSI